MSKVKYRYPGEDFKFVDGDNYKVTSEYINITEWQATGEANVEHPDIPYSRTGWFTRSTFPNKQGGEISLGDITRTGGAKIGESWLFDGKTCYQLGLVGQWWETDSGLITPSRLGSSNSLPLTHFRYENNTYGEKIYWFSNPTFTHWHPVSGQREYTLTVTLKGNTTFSRTEIEIRPDYIEILANKECPENTCPVLCDNTICCYNSQGISINSFLKEYSIY